MKRLEFPEYSGSVVFDLCVRQISDVELRKRFLAQKAVLEAEYRKYDDHSKSQDWFALDRAEHSKKEQIIVGDITKGELMSLYTVQMVGSNGEARNVYDSIRLKARNECPYCGGCGELISTVPSEVDVEEQEEEDVGTLDHFLPKARFPAFSILPENLVPSCGVCNGGMSSKFPEMKSAQPLHPYYDAQHFFDEKWTIATVSESEPVLVNFDVAPPEHWSEEDKSRVRSHFKGCKLRSRYRVRAIPDITSLVEQRRTVHRKLDKEEFREILKSVAENGKLPINGWKRSLYQGLANSHWFCEHKFL